MIRVENLWKRYRTQHGPGDWILRDLNLEIPTGVSVGLIGSNGAGKSTLLRLIGGADQPTKGTISRDCSISWPMGFGDGLQGSLTGRQNLKFVSRIHGREEDIAEISEFVLGFSELGAYFDEPVRTYSTGMKARLQFGLSIAFNFDVYISDEVTAVGDNKFREKAKQAFNDLLKNSSLIMVSHGERALRDFCEAGILLSNGSARWFDDVGDALEEYHKESAPRRPRKPD